MAVQHVRYEADGWGLGELVFEDGRLVWHELPRPARPRLRTVPGHVPGSELQRVDDGESGSKTGPEGTRLGAVPGPVRLVRRLQAYFRGERVDFSRLEVDLEWCTTFQRAVAETLRAIPYGETVAYGELAALAGYPTAQRAAGTFCAHNRTPLFVPCHRVVAAVGLGSYGSLGVEYKRRLLELEGAL